VITLDLVPVIEGLYGQFEGSVIRVLESAKPLNGTKWLMIPVTAKAALDNVKQLLILKTGVHRKPFAPATPKREASPRRYLKQRIE